MKFRELMIFSLLSIVWGAGSSEVLASGGNPVSQLEWKFKKEVLEFHSCGSADACWIAEVKQKKSKRTIAKLRCDGENLFSKVGEKAETEVVDGCAPFEGDNKFQEIPEALRKLLGR